MLTSLKKQHQDACHNHAYPDALLPATGPIGKDLYIHFLKNITVQLCKQVFATKALLAPCGLWLVMF